MAADCAPLGTTATHVVESVLWLVALVGFEVAGLVVLGVLPENWWAPTALVSSIASLVVIALFPIAFPTFSTIGALAIDVAVLGAVLWLHWTPSDLAA